MYLILLLVNPALECCSQDRIERLSNSIDTLNPFEEKRDYFATSVLSESSNLIFDSEGRVQFSKKLLNFAKIKNAIFYLLDWAKHFKFGVQKISKNLNLLQGKKPYKLDQHLKWDNN